MPPVYASNTERKMTIERLFRLIDASNKREAEVLLIKLQSILRQPSRARNIG